MFCSNLLYIISQALFDNYDLKIVNLKNANRTMDNRNTSELTRNLGPTLKQSHNRYQYLKYNTSNYSKELN